MEDTQRRAYFAGFVDGEGSVSLGKSSRGYYHLMVAVGQINPEPLVQAYERWGGYIVAKPDHRGHRTVHQWRLAGQDAADFLSDIRPWLIVKAEEADLAIAFQAHMQIRQEKSPVAVKAALAERERIYQTLKAIKHRSYPLQLRSRGRKGPRRHAVVNLTAGPGSRPNGPKPPHRPQDPVRLAEMQKMRADGATYAAIGAAFGIKRAAAHHLLKRWST